MAKNREKLEQKENLRQQLLPLHRTMQQKLRTIMSEDQNSSPKGTSAQAAPSVAGPRGAAQYTAHEKRDEVLREVKFRERVYQRLVNTGGMTEQLAAKRINIMKQIADDYADLAKKERLL